MKCLICHTSCNSFKYNHFDITCYHCKKCKFIFKSPSVYQDFEYQKIRYDKHENSSENAGYRTYFQGFLDFVFSHIGEQNDTVLDFGCGSSHLLADMFAEKGIESKYFDPIYHADYSYLNNKYDLITSVEVFEHLHDPNNTFGTLLKLLNSGGHIAIRTEFHGGISEFEKWWYPRDSTHVVFFNISSILQLCQNHKCKLVAHNNKNIIVVQKTPR